MGTLYIVATPIGNLRDITIRAVETLFTVDGIACEDTRKTSFLLRSLSKMHDISTYHTQTGQAPRLMSYYEQNEFKRIPEIITALKNGLNIALVSDAGTPTISDPGFKLVRECVREGIKVESIPGPSSVLSALVSSGLPTDKFLFLGYLPKKPGHRIRQMQELFSALQEIKATVILFEAPHKLVQTLKEMIGIFGDMQIVLARELTKMHEEVRKEKISEAINHYAAVSPKGEYVILFNLGEQDASFVTRSGRVE